MTCNKCGKELDCEKKVILRGWIFTDSIYKFYKCINPVCPNYALLQVPQEMMPKPESKKETLEERYGTEMAREIRKAQKEIKKKPSKVRREKKGVTKGEYKCEHEVEEISTYLPNVTHHTNRCKKCGWIFEGWTTPNVFS